MEPGRGAGIDLTDRVRTVAETGSTNADLISLAATGVPEGLWLRAERQTAGKGRQGREWQSDPGNLYASTLVRLRPTDPPAATLSLVAAVALVDAVTAHGFADVKLKWPNDLLLDGAKLAGILLERADDAVVIGFGVNLAHHPVDLGRKTTSLAEHGSAPDPACFCDTLAEILPHWLTRWRTEGVAPVRDRWIAAAHPVGSALAVSLPDGERVEGLFEGLDAAGALRLRLAGGDVHVIHAADVFLI